MPNRQQDYQSGPRHRDDDREHGQYGNPNENDNSVRSANFDQGQGRYWRERDTSEQSGSTGRYAGYGDFGQGDYSQPGRGPNTGQDRYGQTGTARPVTARPVTAREATARAITDSLTTAMAGPAMARTTAAPELAIMAAAILAPDGRTAIRRLRTVKVIGDRARALAVMAAKAAM